MEAEIKTLRALAACLAADFGVTSHAEVAQYSPLHEALVEINRLKLIRDKGRKP